MMARRLPLLAVAALAGGCLLDTGEPDNSFIADYQFANPQTVVGWSAAASDYPAAQEEAVGFVGDVRPRPEVTGSILPALYLRGDNISDDLFMYWYRKVTGFVPNAAYRLGFDVEYISNFSRDCSVGTGASTWIKAGASNIEPRPVLGNDQYYRMNIDKGEQSQSSSTVLNLGDIRNNRVGCGPQDLYGLWGRHSGEDAITVTANANGELWLLVGTESGFEGPHDLYITRFGVRFRPVE